MVRFIGLLVDLIRVLIFCVVGGSMVVLIIISLLFRFIIWLVIFMVCVGEI